MQAVGQSRLSTSCFSCSYLLTRISLADISLTRFRVRLTLQLAHQAMPSSAGAADEGRLPTCLILGGILEGFAAALLLHLHGSKKTQKKASYIRIVDKFLILPQSDTYLKWVHPEARKVLKEGYEHKAVEYVQANIVGCIIHTHTVMDFWFDWFIRRPSLRPGRRYSKLPLLAEQKIEPSI